jgi:hypothetical protein
MLVFKGDGMTACAWFEYTLSVPPVSTAVINVVVRLSGLNGTVDEGRARVLPRAGLVFQLLVHPPCRRVRIIYNVVTVVDGGVTRASTRIRPKRPCRRLTA